MRVSVVLACAASVALHAEASGLLRRRAIVAKSGAPVAESGDSAAPSLAVHEDIFSMIRKSLTTSTKELNDISTARPMYEHRVDDWADTMLASTKKIVETQLASNTNVHLHMKGWLTDLIEEAKSLNKELHERLVAAKKPRPAPFVLEHKVSPPPPDTRTEWEKVEDRSDAQLRDAMNASKGVAMKGVEDLEGKYTQDRQRKYWDLSDQVYKLEASMRKIAPTWKEAKDALEMSKGDMTSQHQGLKDTVDHVERLSRTAKNAVASVKKIAEAFKEN
eukprot:g24.t1